METTRLPRPAPVAGLIQLGLVALLVALAAVGWAVTDERMAGMDAGPGTDPGTFGFYVTAWVVMMAAMMFPSIWPMVVMQIRMQAGKRERGEQAAVGTTTCFVGGYLVTWTAAGIVFYTLLEIGRALDLDALSWDRGGPYLAGAVIIAAAAYQLTPLKDACLDKCRSPLAFLLTAWRPGRVGALRMGIEHGAWCVGCCWALMAALFALGVMSIGWMVFIAALIAGEKLLPWKTLANRGIALLLLVLGIAVMLAPEDVPALTLPDSAEAGQAMDAMGIEGETMEHESTGAPAHEDIGGVNQKDSMGGPSMKEHSGEMP